MIGVYMIKNIKNGKCYIGASSDIDRRWKEHLRSTDEMYLHNEMRKLGSEFFELSVIEECTTDVLFEREEHYIKKYNSTFPNGYNIVSGARSSCKTGSDNHNAVLSEIDVYNIREDYKNHIPIKDAYAKVSEKITENGFRSIWFGNIWREVHMDVYSEENRTWHRENSLIGRNHAHKVNHEEIIRIRKLRSSGVKRRDAIKMFNMNINTFNDVWYYHTFKDITV